MNIADFGFAVELFVIVFSFLCWLFQSSSMKSTNQETKAETKQESVLLVSDGNDTALSEPKLKIDSVDTSEEKDNQEKGDALNAFFQKITIVELRQITSLLKKADIIAKHEKTGGKGIGKVQLVALIKQKLLTDKEAVIEVLKDFNSEIASLI